MKISEIKKAVIKLNNIQKEDISIRKRNEWIIVTFTRRYYENIGNSKMWELSQKIEKDILSLTNVYKYVSDDGYDTEEARIIINY